MGNKGVKGGRRRGGGGGGPGEGRGKWRRSVLFTCLALFPAPLL